MQAQNNQFVPTFRSADDSARDVVVVVLLSLPLSLVDSVRDACLTR